MCQRRTSLIGCCRQRATASLICKHRCRRPIVLPFSKVIFNIFWIIFANLFRQIQSYDKEVRPVTQLFFSDISESNFRCHNLAWQAKLWRIKAWNFHMSCISDGRLWLVVAPRPQRRRHVGLNTAVDDDDNLSFYHSAKLLSSFQHRPIPNNLLLI